MLPLCGIFPVSRAAQETKNAFICGKGWGQGKKQKPEDCAIMAFLNPSRKFVFLVLWKSKAQLLKKESLPGDCSPDATVYWIFLVHMLLGTSIFSPWGRQATVSGPCPEQAYPFPQ